MRPCSHRFTTAATCCHKWIRATLSCPALRGVRNTFGSSDGARHSAFASFATHRAVPERLPEALGGSEESECLYQRREALRVGAARKATKIKLRGSEVAGGLTPSGVCAEPVILYLSAQ